VRQLLLVVVGVCIAAALAGNASAAPGAGGTVTSATTTTTTFVPDPGVTITTDPSKAPANRSVIASPNVLCGPCGGGSQINGCATASSTNGDGYGNWASASYHWCWQNGSVYNNYGWQDEAACRFFCNFQGWNYNFAFSYGFQDKATFRDVSGGIFHVDSTDAACVAVDGWGNAWAC
jgi:hypothetical protein